jgi:quinol monooxygenase YgiN
MHVIRTRLSRRAFVATGVASGLAFVLPARSHNRTLPMEIAIRADNEIVTLINVFVVEPDNQEKLMRLLEEGTETLFSRQPGYIAASFHRSKDGRRVVNYGQWRSAQDIEAFRGKPEIGEYFKRVRELAQFESVVCEVSYVHRV